MKRVLAVLLCMGLTVSMLGCGGSTTETTTEPATAETTEEATEEVAQEEEVTSLEIYAWDNDATTIRPIAEQYEKETGIKINVNEYPNAEYHDKMTLLLNAGQEVDVMDVGFIANISPYVDKGMLEPLNSYIDASGLDMSAYGEGYAAYAFDGEYYTLPLRRVEWLMYANTDILDEMGVEIPENMTWDQYVEIAKELTVGEGADKQYGGQWMPWTKHMMLVQAGKTILDDDLTELQQTYEFLNQVMNVDDSFMDVAEMSAGANDYISWFVNGQTATMVQGEWCVQLVNELLTEEGITDFNYDCYPMPINEGIEPLTTGGNYSTWGVAATSTKKQAAYDFLNYIAGEEPAKQVAATGKIPGYCNEEIQQIFIDNSGLPSAADMFTFKVYDLMPSHVKAGEINTMMNEESELYLVGSQTIEQTMENIYARREEILAD